MKIGSIVIALAGLTLTTGAYAQSSTGSTATSTTSSKSLYQKLKDSPVSLRLSLNADVDRKSGSNKKTAEQNKADGVGKTSGYTFTNIAYLGYKLTKKDSIRMENRWTARKKFANAEDEPSTKHSYSRMVLKYSRSGILNQKEHGINMSASVEKRFNPDHESRARSNRYGLNRASLNVSRSFDNNVSLSASLLISLTDRIKKKVATTTSHYYLLYTTQAYSFTDKLSLSFTQEWFNGHKKNNGELDSKGNRIAESFAVTGYLELGYQLLPQVSTSLSVSLPITEGHDSEDNDGNFFVKNIQHKMAFAGNVSISAF